MANPHRGAVELKAGDRTYQLSFSVNALCELEAQLGEPVAKIATALGKPEEMRLTTLRAVVWAGLRDHHEEVTLKEAGLIATDAGIQACGDAIGRAFELAFPEGSETDRPPVAKD